MTPTLSPRQRQVLTFLAAGYNVKQSARLLGITYDTAASHSLRAMRKLNACSITHAVAIAICRHIIDGPLYTD